MLYLHKKDDAAVSSNFFVIYRGKESLQSISRWTFFLEANVMFQVQTMAI